MCILYPMRLRLALLALLSAVLITLAVPNELFTYGNALFDLICLVPLWLAIALSPTRRYSHLLGLLFGVLSSLATYFWLAFFRDFSTWTIGGVTLGFAYQFFIFAPFLYTFARASSRWRPFVFAAAWTVYEYFKSIGFLGFPWGLLAYPVGGILPLVQIADITGVWGVSFLVAAVNGMIGETLMRWLRVVPQPLPTDSPSLPADRRAGGSSCAAGPSSPLSRLDSSPTASCGWASPFRSRHGCRWCWSSRTSIRGGRGWRCPASRRERS